MPTKKRRPVSCQYRTAVACAILHATDMLTPNPASDVAPRPIHRRLLVNFLRACKVAEGYEQGGRHKESYGLLESHDAAWIHAVVDRLVEEGYLLLEFKPQGMSLGVSLTRAGRTALAQSSPFPPDILPTRARLGSHPELEEKLWSLRQALARAEGCTAFAVFPNGTLAAIAAERPKNLAALAEIRGMGEARIRKYGRRILAAIRG